MPFQKGHKINNGRVSWNKGKSSWNKNIKGISTGPKGHHWKNPIIFSIKLSNRMKGNKYSLGKKQTPDTIEKRVSQFRGKNHPNWIKDRTQLKDDHRDRGGQLHREWSNSVKKRDNWKCKINNKDCHGRIEAHHILSWVDFVELRYNISNGIALCHYHHPKKKREESNLISFFKSLILK